MDAFATDIGALSKLLSTQAVDGREAGSARPPTQHLTPSTLLSVAAPAAGDSGSRLSAAGAASSRTSTKPSASKDIWDADEIDAGVGGAGRGGVPCAPDHRVRPAFDILYKQRVGAEDVYLGMSGITPSSVDCNEMVIKVTLPGVVLKDIQLDVKPQQCDVSTPLHKLALPLPHRVRHREGTAKWDADKHVLAVTVPIVRADPF